MGKGLVMVDANALSAAGPKQHPNGVEEEGEIVLADRAGEGQKPVKRFVSSLVSEYVIDPEEGSWVVQVPMRSLVPEKPIGQEQTSGSASVEIYHPLIVVVPVSARAAEVRLEDGGSRCAGRVEVKHQGRWGTVCPVFWDMKDAAVVCKQLGCGSALQAHREAYFGPGSGPIWTSGFDCDGTESALSDCTQKEQYIQYCDHSMDAGVTCSEYTGFRLLNGSTACEGRVEVQVLGTWGTLCATHWDLLDAHVLCRHLGCGSAESIPRGGHFGNGTSPIWRDSFHNGTEAHLGQCPVTALGASPCSHENYAAVICSGPAASMSLRLVAGGSRCNGRVEIFQRGTWGRALDDQWDTQEASVVCRQLQCEEAEKAYNPSKAQRGTGPVGLQGVRCAGHEANLSLCNTSLPKSALAAGIAEDVGVVCWGSRQLWLVNGSGHCAGRVEIYYQGSWGTVCDDGWDLPDTAVVCQQLGCGGAVEAVGSARFGEGSGQIWLDGVNCSRAEAALWDCPSGSWGQHNCAHKEDAGVVCSEFVDLRLENSTNCSGRLQVFYNETWGSVCSNSMPLKTVSLTCKEPGCGDGGSLETPLTSGRVSGPTWLDLVECGERNSSFWQCPSAPWNPQSCDDLREETHITCNGRQQETPLALGAMCPNALSCTAREKIHAVGGENGCSGRVEVWHCGSWRTVCDASWDMQDAEVACRQLGCGPAVSALGEAAFGEGTGPIWLEQAECRGTEPSLQDCCAQPGDSGACRHKKDASVRCSAAARATAPTPRADPTRGCLTGSGSVSLPVIICIILRALLCLLLALLVGQVRSTRAGHRGSQRAWEPFPEAVNEEIGYSPAWEKQVTFGSTGSPGSYSEGVPDQAAALPRDSKEEDDLGSAPDAPVMPRGDPADGYDDAREIPDPGEDPVSGQGDWEMPMAAGPRDASGESTGYDNAEEVSLAHPPEDTKAVTAELSAQPSLSPGPAEPVPALGLGAARREKRSVQLGEP
ncbi:LOW QUALITY PROTEIN: antigen WC1.1-like [Chlamydotis macqueenii]